MDVHGPFAKQAPMSRRLSQLKHSSAPGASAIGSSSVQGSSGPGTPSTPILAGAATARRLSLSTPGVNGLGTPASGGRTRASARAVGVESPAAKRGRTLEGTLQRLVAQLRKRDNYAFFLQPVDEKEVPGYRTIIKHPMDLGTMTQKVDKGRYKSMEEFKEDFLLVTTNAKTFNPPSTIFHTEAVKLEKYGLDAIKKAQQKLVEAEQQAQVWAEQQAVALAAQHEYDMQHQDEVIKVESDGEGPEDAPRGLSLEHGSRSVSAAPTPGQAAQMRLGKRRGGYRPRGAPKSIDELWKIPGPETGIGTFPYGSDLAGLMLEFEIMGRKTLTKKERAKLERHPLRRPIAPDGSVDYTEMEDPYAFLSVFLPEPFGQPQLELVPPASTSAVPKPKTEVSAYPGVYPSVSVPPTTISMRSIAEDEPIEDDSVHWSIQRPGMNSYRSYYAREEEELRKQAEREGQTKEVEVRDPAPTDWGSFGTLPMKWAVGDSTWWSDESKLHMKIREDIRKAAERLRAGGKKKADAEPVDEAKRELEKAAYGGEAWLRDVVYGGPEGIAYVQSIASFVSKAMKYAKHDEEEPVKESSVKEEEDVDMDAEPERPRKRRRTEEVDESILLPKPLPDYVSDLVIDPLTSGLHEILDRIGESIEDPELSLPRHLPQLGKHLDNSVNQVPEAEKHVSEMTGIVGEQLDMGAVLRAPDEFFFKDDEWTQRSKKGARTEDSTVSATTPAANGLAPASPAYINYGLAKAAESILRLSHSGRAGASTSSTQVSDGTAVEDTVAGAEEGEDADDRDKEDPEMRKLRLNLLTMTRHVPLAELAPLRPELIPAHVRHLFPARIGGDGA
ncbi:hypothetical protein CALCODRAFT_457251 [Calocera cornea HHB12733]|uniref:Bromo domain-containing protein n=1 Tax=Calocera cornea HHB12733 TaxID=1353952 RepID=A0A165E3L7_9BASI|nr:hypothetical protein CALCODRAFT_457251 [Calocera cornea HHB12733]